MARTISRSKRITVPIGMAAAFGIVGLLLQSLIMTLLCSDPAHLELTRRESFLRHFVFNPDSCFQEYWWLQGFLAILTCAVGLGFGFKILKDMELERRLRDSERRLNEAFNIVNEGVFEWYYREARMSLSESFFRMCGLDSRREFMTLAEWRKMIHPDDVAHENRQMSGAMENGGALNFQIRLKHADGHYFPVHIRGLARPDEKHPGCSYILGTVRDISGDLAAQQRLCQLENRLHSTFVAEGEGLLEIKLPGLVISSDWMPHWKIAGVNWHNLVGCELWRMLETEPFVRLTDWVEATAFGGENTPLVMDAMFRLNSRLTIPSRLVFNRISGENALTLNIRDLTSERESALNTLLLKQASDNLLTGILIARQDGTVYYHNAVVRKLANGEVKPESKIWNLVPELDRNAFRTVAETAKARGTYSLRWDTGGRNYEVSCYFLAVSDGFFCFYVNDRTENIEQENKLLRALTAEQQANQKRLELLNNINYELRKPLTGILGFADLLQDDSLPPDERREYLNFITQSGNHLLKLWTGVLELTTLECGMLDVEASEVNLNSVMTNVQNIARPLLNENIELRCRKTLRDVDAAIISDESIIDRIFERLLENAVQRVQSGWIEIGYSVAEERVNFYVSDNGSTLTTEQKARVFEPFGSGFWTQGDTVELGLAIAKLMIALLHGSINVQNNPGGEGACFGFSIPLTAKVPDNQEK